jgi:RNA polymerase sigma-70 factor (ECF subfamily)
MRVSATEPLAFEPWYRQVHPRLITLLAATAGERDLACDAADEAFARAFERWEHVSRMASPTGWTYRVALNVLRRRARRRDWERRLIRRPPRDNVPGPSGELWMLVTDLPIRQRTAVLLRHVAQLTEQEIADVMGVARGTVSSTLRAAYRRLAVEVTDDETLLKESAHE